MRQEKDERKKENSTKSQKEERKTRNQESYFMSHLGQ